MMHAVENAIENIPASSIPFNLVPYLDPELSNHIVTNVVTPKITIDINITNIIISIKCFFLILIYSPHQ